MDFSPQTRHNQPVKISESARPSTARMLAKDAIKAPAVPNGANNIGLKMSALARP